MEVRVPYLNTQFSMGNSFVFIKKFSILLVLVHLLLLTYLTVLVFIQKLELELETWKNWRYWYISSVYLSVENLEVISSTHSFVFIKKLLILFVPVHPLLTYVTVLSIPYHSISFVSKGRTRTGKMGKWVVLIYFKHLSLSWELRRILASEIWNFT